MWGNERQEWVQRARAVPIETEIQRRGIKLRRVGAERVGPCPKCGGDDRFAVNVKKQVFNCRGCGIKGDVIQLVEHLDGVDFNAACATLAGPSPKKPNGKDHVSGTQEIVVAEFSYHDESGNVLSVVERREYQKPDGSFVVNKDGKHKKTFKQKRPDPERPGEPLWNVDGVRVVPYALPQVIEAIAADHPVLVVEGEAKADLLRSWNIAATCCAGGAKKWKPEHSKFLGGADVILLPDNDGAGWEHANALGAALSGVAKRTRVLVLPGLPLKGDVIDWANAGGTRERFDALLEQAQDWKAPTTEGFDEKAAAKAREDELLASLATAQGLDYQRQLSAAARELKVTPSAVDAEVKARREKAPLYGHWINEPAPDTVEGDSLLRDIIRKLRRHVFCSPEDALACALWVCLSWTHDVTTQ